MPVGSILWSRRPPSAGGGQNISLHSVLFTQLALKRRAFRAFCGEPSAGLWPPPGYESPDRQVRVPSTSPAFLAKLHRLFPAPANDEPLPL